VGAFIYSHEEGTPAYDLPGQVPASVAKQRFDALMKVQQSLSLKRQEVLVGQTLEVLIEARVKDEMTCYTGRSCFDAPDVDGLVHVNSARPLRAGDLVKVRITAAMAYDLQGEAA
jgi:ribosomal protein S12 methylthiotransferase